MTKVKEKRYIVTSLRDLASIFKVSVNAVERWRARGMPGQPGAWDLRAILDWKKRRELERAGLDPDLYF